ncbi:MAG: 50S ribosomal protein L15 [Candidatus Omnitrophica bacterium]|nr:50S ribosomal protein L15 [Candidatus Omnitrophota bacterium]
MNAKVPYKKKKKRLGRGPSSGHGKTSTKGHKGQLARSGQGKGWFPGFEGGQMPFIRRVPKRGFNSPFRKKYSVINLDQIADTGEDKLTPGKALELRLISRIKDGLKILGEGDLKKAIHVEAHAFSASAKQKIEKAGGKAVVLQSV